MAWFRRKQDESMDPQVLLAKAQAAERSAGPAGVDAAGGFRLTVEDVFSIQGRGTVVTGYVLAGRLAKGATVRLVRADGTERTVTVTGIEAFRKVLDVAEAGQTVGLLLDGLSRRDIAAGDQILS